MAILNYAKSAVEAGCNLFFISESISTIRTLGSRLSNSKIVRNFCNRVKTFYKNHEVKVKKVTAVVAVTSIFVPKLRRIITSNIPPSVTSILTALTLFFSV